jgi:hypothetical protein
MKTDYKNLNSFEVSAVVLAASGLALIGTIMFSSLSANQQEHFITAIRMFDIHEQAGEELVALENIFEYQQNFMNQFYIAFAQEAQLPDSVMQAPTKVAQAYNSFLAYSDQFEADYQRTYTSPHRQLALEPGLVSGISVSSSETNQAISGCGSSAKQAKKAEELKLPYAYVPPNWVALSKKVEHIVSTMK